MELQHIPLDQLHFGHEAGIPINARKVGREADIASLAASIKAHGLGQPLNVRELDTLFYVVDGNRRLAALQVLQKDGHTPADWPVPCATYVPHGGGSSDELSLALNFQRVAMHPADEYEKFHELKSRGLSPKLIAERFGIEPKRVARILALGALSPVILDAWRTEKLGDRPFEVVTAFTMAPSIEEQERVFKKLSDTGQMWSHNVRAALGMNGDRDASSMLKVIGLKAYKAAGGAIVEDLFGESHHIADPSLLKKLWDEKLANTIADHKADGWSWVEMSADLPYSWTYSWEKGEADKAKSGAVISVNYSHEISVTTGVVKPKSEKQEKAKDAAPEPPTISDAIMQRLSVQLTQAAKDTITSRPQVALAAIVAGLASSGYGVPIRVSANGILKEPREVEEFHVVLGRTLAMSVDQLLAALATEAKFTLDLQSANRYAPPLGKLPNSLLLEALDPVVLQEALQARFDPEDYFKTVPRSFTEAAILEAVGEEEARASAKLKKGELVKFAVQGVPKTGWLPAELRTKTYAGPAAIKPKAKKKAA